MKIDRIFHHYEQWEDYQNGMYIKSFDINLIDKAEKLLANPLNLYIAMNEVINKWPISSADNLSNSNINRQAWLGQAACCLICNCPENLTKEAWHKLTDDERRLANRVADEIILKWEINYLSSKDEIYGQRIFKY